MGRPSSTAAAWPGRPRCRRRPWPTCSGSRPRSSIPSSGPLITGLPVAGVEGSLRTRYFDDQSAGRPRCRTRQDRHPAQGAQPGGSGPHPGRIGAGLRLLGQQPEERLSRQGLARHVSAAIATCGCRLPRLIDPVGGGARRQRRRGMTTSMVDWTVALNTATKLVKPGPEISRSGRRRGGGRTARLRDPGRGVRRRRSPGCRPRRHLAGVGGRPAALDPGQPRRLPADPAAAQRQGRGEVAVRRLDRGRDRPAVTGFEVGALLSYLAPKVLGQFDPFFPGWRGRGPTPVPGRPAAAGRAEHRGDRARTGRHPGRFPALGLPARGDPPGAVRRRALAPRLSECPDRRGRRFGRARSRGGGPDDPRRHQAGGRRAARKQGGVDHRPGADPGPEADRRPDHRRDVAARRPCRRGDGRGRSRGHPPSVERSGPSSAYAARARASTRSSASCSVWMPRCGSIATARPSVGR